MQQNTGLRQGCPLSPYLFVTVMTVIYHDVHANYRLLTERQRIIGTHNDEVLYADDTMCFSQNTAAMNRLLHAIEQEGAKYGMNKDKCEYISIGQKGGVVRFRDGTKVPVKDEVRYLGCNINNKGDPSKELNQRISTCMSIFNRLHLFWRHSDCTIRLKLEVYDAIIRSKLMYGLESVVLNDTQARRLDTFQLKGLRKILKIDTTYVDRAFSNAYVYDKASQALSHGHKRIQHMTEFHAQRRKVMLAKLLTLGTSEPGAQATLQHDKIAPHDHGKQKVGRKIQNWTIVTIKEFWDEVRETYEEAKGLSNFDPDSPDARRINKKTGTTIRQ